MKLKLREAKELGPGHRACVSLWLILCSRDRQQREDSNSSNLSVEPMFLIPTQYCLLPMCQRRIRLCLWFTLTFLRCLLLSLVHIPFKFQTSVPTSNFHAALSTPPHLPTTVFLTLQASSSESWNVSCSHIPSPTHLASTPHPRHNQTAFLCPAESGSPSSLLLLFLYLFLRCIMLCLLYIFSPSL